MKMIIKSYSELITLPTFEERYKYLKIGGEVGRETFGFDRYLNQKFYNSYEYRLFRRKIILRDMGFDLGVEDHPIQGKIIIHHINPIEIDDILRVRLEVLMNPENSICTSLLTHNAIHYGDESLIFKAPVERTKNDTCPWKHN